MTAKQQLFVEMNAHLLKDEMPSQYLDRVSENSFFKELPFTVLNRLKETPQSPKYHPEGSVWRHTMLVIDAAANAKSQSEDQQAFMWAALLHDIGKPDTTKNRSGKITTYDHDKLGAEMAKKFLIEFTDDLDFIQRVTVLIRWHMQILYVVKSLPFADIKTMKHQTNISEVALLGLCDRLGRLGADDQKEAENVRTFLKKCDVR